MQFRLTPLAQLLSATIVLTLAACGGGGSDGDPVVIEPAPPTNAPVMATLSGNVFGDQAIRNAVVCLDLNANSACDTDEPASSRTGADGAYSLGYDTAKVTAAQVAGASLIAPMVPGAVTGASTTLDAANPAAGNTAKAYVLKQVPGKAGQINPLTTLVAKGVADGMTEGNARANAAQQLQITEAKIDNYQDEPATDNADVQDNARWLAQVVKSALEEGVALRVADQSSAVEAAPSDLAQLRYTDAANYFVRTFNRVAKAAGAPGVENLDARTGKSNGNATSHTDGLYNFAYLTPKGWIRCDGPWGGTMGTPNRSIYCGVSPSAGFSVPSTVAGRSMAAVVDEMQTDPRTNVINNGLPFVNLVSALGSAVFPANAAINARHNLTLAPSIFINSVNTDGRPQSQAQTLEQLIAFNASSGVNLPAPGRTLSLGLSSGDFKNLRVAFIGTTSATEGTVQFYECDLDVTQQIPTNCAAKETGTYAIATVHGARVIRFAGHAPTIMNHAQLYAEVQNAPTVISGNWVFRAREAKPDLANSFSVKKRLNATAWAAMKSQLGL